MKKHKLLWLLPAIAAVVAILILLIPKGEDGWRPAAHRPQQSPTEEFETDADPPSSTETNPITPQEPSSPKDPGITETKPEATAPPPQETDPITLPPLEVSKPLEYSGYGRYSGAYVEDGFDQQVENVAVILVRNISQEFLEFANIQFSINGKPAEFSVNGLPPGTAAWVLENNRMVIPPGSEFVYVDEITGFSKGGNVTDDLYVELGVGSMTALNTGDSVMKDVYVYYKQLHTDGNFLGGITYRVSFGDLKPDTGTEPVAVSATAGHCTPDGCQVVKVTKDE